MDQIIFSGYYFLLRSYKKGLFYFMYIFFTVQSESEIRFFAVEPINTFYFFVVFLCFFGLFVWLGYFRLF